MKLMYVSNKNIKIDYVNNNNDIVWMEIIDVSYEVSNKLLLIEDKQKNKLFSKVVNLKYKGIDEFNTDLKFKINDVKEIAECLANRIIKDFPDLFEIIDINNYTKDESIKDELEINSQIHIENKLEQDINKPVVTIIILQNNNINYTKLCLSTLKKYTDSSLYKLILVDNNSDKQSDYIEYFSKIEKISTEDKYIFAKENYGFIKASNHAISLTDTKYILLLNNDVILTNRWLNKLIKVLETDKDVAIVSSLRMDNYHGITGLQFEKNIAPDYKEIFISDTLKNIKLYKTEKEKLIMLINRVNEINEYLENLNNNKYFKDNIMTPFFCTLFRKEVFDKYGLLDNDFGMGLHEDSYYCWKVRKAGYKVASCLDTYVHHFCSSTFKNNITVEAYNKIVEQNFEIMSKKINNQIPENNKLEIIKVIKEIIK